METRIFHQRSAFLNTVTTCFVLVILWYILDKTLLGSFENFPGPVEVFNVLIKDTNYNELLLDMFSSLSRVFVGLIIAIFLGVLLGVGLATLGSLGMYLSNYIEFFRPISPIAWIPIAIIWFGIGEASSYFIIFLAAFFPIFTNTFTGARSVNHIHNMLAQSMLLSRVQYLKHILFPSATPQIITGVRIGLGFAWMAVIASEMVAAQSGLGYMIQINRLLMNTEKVIIGMIVIGIIGFIMNKMALLLEVKLIPWQGNNNDKN